MNNKDTFVKIKAKNLSLAQIAKSGQCFRLNEYAPGKFNLMSTNNLLFLEQDNDDITLFCSQEDYQNIWSSYFDMENDYASMIESIPASDTYLTAAADYGRGIRILRQDPWEMLITFIISQRKNMPAIRSCVEKISRRFGDPVSSDKALSGNEFPGTFYAFPTPDQLANASLDELKDCSLGYRAPYIKETAQTVVSGACDLDALKELETPELFEALKSFKGVGDKVANCILLFAYHRLEAFPIDVWIRRILDNYYDGSFDTSLYQGYAGVIQQYMFFYETSRP